MKRIALRKLLRDERRRSNEEKRMVVEIKNEARNKKREEFMSSNIDPSVENTTTESGIISRPIRLTFVFKNDRRVIVLSRSTPVATIRNLFLKKFRVPSKSCGELCCALDCNTYPHDPIPSSSLIELTPRLLQSLSDDTLVTFRVTDKSSKHANMTHISDDHDSQATSNVLGMTQEGELNSTEGKSHADIEPGPENDQSIEEVSDNYGDGSSADEQSDSDSLCDSSNSQSVPDSVLGCVSMSGVMYGDLSRDEKEDTHALLTIEQDMLGEEEEENVSCVEEKVRGVLIHGAYAFIFNCYSCNVDKRYVDNIGPRHPSIHGPRYH
jgi:hypothetical protein